ncbi:dromyosuppressin [Episyrphus balteatus]|uniref:dromyosuppressin n=1 Tax=Episyrphus balteatus TaxID=286459 RepID=UPI0024856544|nr:dromyosuppressin [Episyrphus balteatus]
MSSHIIATLIISSVLLAIFGMGQTSSVSMAPLCEPGIIDEMPQHIKKVCLALENSDQLSSALRAYIKNEAAALMSKTDDLVPLNYGKRTDVDHVFLRFGKRR